jgi:5-methylthioribose kinase
MRWLNRLVPGSVPEFVFEDFESHLLAMQAVPEPHENWKEMLLAGKLALAHVEQFATLLGAMHRRAAESTEDLKSAFADCSFFESLRLEPYYGYAANRLPESREFLIDLMRDTQVRHLTLVHGDFSPKNVLVHDGRLLLLDHEVIHWGDPAFDLGFALTHMMSKLHHVRGRKYARAVPEFCRTYSAVVGPVYWDDNLEAMAVRHTIGCLLARVAGRSPLEYLDHRRRQKQQAFALAAMLRPPSSIEQLLMGFLLETGPYGDD